MNKKTMLKIVNPAIAFLILIQVLTGFFHELLPEEAFEALHVTSGILLAAGVIWHLYLNWAWVKATYLSK